MANMKALQIMAPDQVEIVSCPIPEPGAGQVLVRVSEVNTCPQWDLHILSGRPMFARQSSIPYPYPIGQPAHEMTGTVAGLGAGVTEFQVGDQVSSWKDQGQDRLGCYAQYALFEAENLLPVPDGVDPARTTSLELAMCISTTILDLVRWNGLKNQRVGISGLGPAGLVAAQLARAEGASEIVGFEPNPTRAEFAADWCIDRAIDPTSPEGRAFPTRSSKQALDTSIDCVGAAASFHYLMDHTREVVAVFGVQREDFLYHHAGLRLFGYPGHHRQGAEYAMQRIVEGKLDLLPLTSARLPLERYIEGIELLRQQEALKICYLPWES